MEDGVLRNIKADRKRGNRKCATCLHEWRDVDRVSRSPCGGEGGLRLGCVPESIVHPRFNEVGLYQQLLVVHTLQFAKKLI